MKGRGKKKAPKIPIAPGHVEWWGLADDTFRAVRREDVTDLYEVEWRQAADHLIDSFRESIQGESRCVPRALRSANAVLYGLLKRLTPARRLLLATSLVALFWALVDLVLADPNRTSRLFPVLLFLGAGAIQTLLLGMELVDKIQFRNELFLARDLQAELVPRTPPEVSGYELGAYNRIANTVGGDLYDFEVLPDGRLSMLFGDASGHGMTAGLVMAVTHAAYRTSLDVDPTPTAVVQVLNKVLCRTGACRTRGPRQFFAGIVLTLEKDGRFQAVVAGHPPILKLDSKGQIVEQFGRGSYPAGIKPQHDWPVENGSLDVGETLLFHSDGLSEGPNSEGEPFGDERIRAVAGFYASKGAIPLTEALAGAFAQFLGRRPADDDVSIAAIRRVA